MVPRERAILDLIVHELRTPLSVAAGSLPQVTAGAVLTGGQQGAADRVARALEKLNELVNQLRSCSRLADSPAGTPVPVASALAHAVEAADTATRHITVTMPDVAGDIRIMSPREQFIPVLAGAVAAVVRSAPDRSTVPVDVSGATGEVRISIGDVSDAHESEFQAEFAGGLGFSMPMARAAIEGVGGRIWSKDVDGRIAGIGLALKRA